LDIDPRKNGDTSWAKLIEQHGELPPTPTVQTGGGGAHYYLTFPDSTGCSSGRVGEEIDVKAVGGYVIVPPSKINCPEHNRRSYKWLVKPWEQSIAVAPDWLVNLTNKPTTNRVSPKNTTSLLAQQSLNPAVDWTVKPDWTLYNHPGSPQGQRRVTLLELVSSALGLGDSHASIWEAARQWANRCVHHLTNGNGMLQGW
jgi:hypothetical protein